MDRLYINEGEAMTFKDKEKEIKEFVNSYHDKGITEDLWFEEIKNVKGEQYIFISIRNYTIIFIFEMHEHIRAKSTNKTTHDIHEIKFIYNFIEYLESLGFKEGE